MNDLAALAAVLDLLMRDRRPGHAVAIAEAARASLARTIRNPELIDAAGVVGRVTAKALAQDGDVAGALSVAPHLDAIAERHPRVIEDGRDFEIDQRVTPAERWERALLAADQCAPASVTASVTAPLGTTAEAARLARQVASCRARLVDLERRHAAAVVGDL